MENYSAHFYTLNNIITRWSSVKKCILCSVALLTLFVYTNTSLARQPNYWLPIAYQLHYNRLLEAAEKVSALDECYDLLSGTLSERQSSVSHPVFLFRCRTEQRTTFLITVDSKTLKLTNTIDVWRKKVEKEKERQQQEVLRQKLAQRSRYWAVCEKEFQDKTRTFNQPKIISPLPPKPDISSEGAFTYFIEFETLSLKNNTLSYLATAEIQTLAQCTIKIRPI